jgi:hypothetical protein
MARTLRTELEIEAAGERVWAVLTDFPTYPAWNPFIKSIQGVPSVGERLRVRLEPPGGRALTVRPRVLSVIPGRELTWLGHLVVRGVFDGEHRFLLKDVGAGRVRFIQEELFNGVLVALTGKVLAQTEAGFVAMNGALKKRAEGA